ncbi:uncharacterized protein [Miscanthus floridulus]|uniref:uncharacterized protein n=1 Tax=Miscanthus floridulus TaxID=154761 RepID=UPI00345866F3
MDTQAQLPTTIQLREEEKPFFISTLHQGRPRIREDSSTSLGIQKKMRRVLPLCALLVVLLCVASLVDVTEAAERGGGRGGRSIGGAGAGARGSHGGGPRGLSGGTWTACVRSSLLAAAAMLL